MFWRKLLFASFILKMEAARSTRKCCYQSANLHDVASQKTIRSIITAVRNSNLTKFVIKKSKPHRQFFFFVEFIPLWYIILKL